MIFALLYPISIFKKSAKALNEASEHRPEDQADRPFHDHGFRRRTDDARLLGTHATVVLAGADAALCSLQLKNKRNQLWYNTAVMSLAAFASSAVVGAVFGDQKAVSSDLSNLAMASGLLALTHYAINSGLTIALTALKSGRSLFTIWKDYFLWTSISYLAGALTARLVVKLFTVILL